MTLFILLSYLFTLQSWASPGGWFDGSTYYSSLMVSASSLPLPTGAAQEHAASNSPNACRLSDGTNWLSSLPVTGTFWQATQPVSIASMPSTPVTGTFWQATQPVSGTFWQATQPVSLAATVTVSQATTGANPCMNPAATLVSATGATSGTAAVQIVALSGSTKIYLCSLNVMGVSGTTPTFSLVQGTGSNCATGQTKVVQPWTTAAGTLYPFANPIAVGTSGNALCYLDTGTTPVQNYTLTYVQQ